MKTLLFTLLIITNLIAKTPNSNNPVVYSALGDSIYNNAPAIENLQKLKEFKVHEDKIITYIDEVNSAKAMGYAIEEGDKSISKGIYLKKLRVLSKTNDFFIKNISSNFKFAIKNEDNKLFVNSVDSNLLNTDRYKKQIHSYYNKHEDDISEYGDVLSSLVNKNGKVKKKVYKGKSKQELQDEKMNRIRKKDKDKQKAIHKALEDELIRKKVDIRDTQEKELESTSK